MQTATVRLSVTPHTSRSCSRLPHADADDEEELTPEEQRRRKVRKAKRAVRSELSVSGGHWTRRGYANTDILRCVSARVCELAKVVVSLRRTCHES